MLIPTLATFDRDGDVRNLERPGAFVATFFARAAHAALRFADFLAAGAGLRFATGRRATGRLAFAFVTGFAVVGRAETATDSGAGEGAATFGAGSSIGFIQIGISFDDEARIGMRMPKA